MSRFGLAFATSTAALTATPLAAQEGAEPIHEAASDEYGVERKTGKALFPLPELINIGGEGSAHLNVGFVHADGSSLTMPSEPFAIYSLVNQPQPNEPVNNNPYFPYHMKMNVNYGGINENFRRLHEGPGPSDFSENWEPEFSNGSTFEWTGSNPSGVSSRIFTSRQGVKITVNNVEHPDGGLAERKTVEYPSGIVKSFYRRGFDNWAMRNNFGYAIKWVRTGPGVSYATQPEGVRTYQALNQVVDACDLEAAALCGSVTKDRQATLEGISGYRATQNTPAFKFLEKVKFTDPSGQVTQIRNELFNALTSEPNCLTTTYTTSAGSYDVKNCNGERYGAFPYPVGLTLPGSSVENVTFTYSGGAGIPLQPGATVSSISLIRIMKVIKNGVEVDYNPMPYKPSGSAYGGPQAVPEWLHLSSSIDGQQISYSMSFKPFPIWGHSRQILYYVDDALDRRTSYSHNQHYQVSGTTSPEGNGVILEYDARHNIVKRIVTPKPDSGLPDLETTFTYASTCTPATQASCNKPLTITDPNGNVTDYTYNSRGQVLTERQPAPSAGAARPTVVNEYTLRTAFIKDATGNTVAAGPPISLLTKSFTCITSANCSAASPAADKVVTVFDYGPTNGLNNLSLIGMTVTAANGQGQIETLRTCYSYNYFGEKISETQPRADLASCPA